MSASSPQNRGSYNLRPRFKAVISVKSRIKKKVAQAEFAETESPGIKKKIADREKLSFDETESPGQRFLAMTSQELDKHFHDNYTAKGFIHKPPTPLSDEERDRIREKNNLRLAETGLSYLNDPANAVCSGDAKYELVNPIAGRFFICCNPRPCGVTHSNFEAKLKNDPEAEVQLFFLEIVEKPHGVEKVTCCCSLGRRGSKAAATGLRGCKVCSKINHPKGKRFITR